jgi:hypothetical protein
MYCCCRYVYERLTPKGRKPGFLQLMATQLTSAIWHGLYPGESVRLCVLFHMSRVHICGNIPGADCVSLPEPAACGCDVGITGSACDVCADKRHLVPLSLSGSAFFLQGCCAISSHVLCHLFHLLSAYFCRGLPHHITLT